MDERCKTSLGEASGLGDILLSYRFLGCPTDGRRAWILCTKSKVFAIFLESRGTYLFSSEEDAMRFWNQAQQVLTSEATKVMM